MRIMLAKSNKPESYWPYCMAPVLFLVFQL